MNPKAIIALFASLVFCSSLLAVELERRMAVTLGAGKTRYLIAEVDPGTDNIVNVIDSGAFDTGFQIDLIISNNRTFSKIMFERAKDVFDRLKNKYEYYDATRFKVIAGQAFRVASNGQELADAILKHSGFAVSILNDEKENQLDYFSALQASQNSDRPAVWDISTHNFQLIMEDNEGETFTHKGNFGSVNFMDYVLEVVQKKDASTQRKLHPLTREQAENAIHFARFLASKVPAVFKDNIIRNDNEVLAIGTMFRYSISGDIAGHKGVVSQKTLHQHIERWLSSEDRDQHSKSTQNSPDAFSHVNLANALLVYGFMVELGIEKLNISSRSTTENILEYTPYWR